jgi:hypothetical protein
VGEKTTAGSNPYLQIKNGIRSRIPVQQSLRALIISKGSKKDNPAMRTCAETGKKFVGKDTD